MKEATGELNMTVITVIAIAAVAALFYAFVWPMIQRTIVQRTCDSFGTGYTAQKQTNAQLCVGENDNAECWICKCDKSKGSCKNDIKAK